MPDAVTHLNAALEGRYEIERELGEGGMATVYLAKDVKHNRNVALKVLKPELAAVVGAERFLAEIETTANLQHPHILPLFDSGEADGFLFYVMPYVEGETLREKLDREHQLPVDDAVLIAKNVAEALDYAHSQGVIHRDIKPANILLQAGKPVVSDFGIALAVGAAGGGRLTETGLSLGTPHYMSPEQATGDLSVGTATDVYALGCVLYEMLVGEPPFTGSTPQAVLGKIITGAAPSAHHERNSVPPNVDGAIRRALEKVPADRFRDAASLVRAVSDSGFRHGEPVVAVPGAAAPRPGSRLAAVFAFTTLVASGLAVWALLEPEPPLPVVRSVVNVRPAEDHGLALSPDGSMLIVAEPHEFPGDPNRLVARPLGSLVATPVPGSDGREVLAPTMSPDGNEVAFYADGDIKVATLSSGLVRTVAEGAAMGPVTWGPDGYVYHSTSDGIARTHSQGEGGPTEEVTRVQQDDLSHHDFTVLPGGAKALFVVRGPDGTMRVVALDVASGERRVLTPGHSPRVTPTGHLVFGSSDGRLLAAAFDAREAELTGPIVPIVDGLRVYEQQGFISYSLSEEGTLAYVAGGGDPIADAQFVWVSRSGQIEPVDPEHAFVPGSAPGWQLSPGDTHIAFKADGEQGEDIWVKELPRGPLSRLTFTSSSLRTYRPFWTPDGLRVTYFSGAGDDRSAWAKRADGVGEPVLLIDGSFAQGAWSPDGTWLVLRSISGRNILGFRPEADSAPVPFVASEFLEDAPAISPNGRWLAYSSNESGRDEIYVRPFPNVDSTRVQVSIEGGVKPVWAHSGRELFFVSGAGEMVSASITEGGGVSALATLFTLPDGIIRTSNSDFFDVSSDDQRFLMAQPSDEALEVELDLVLVQNFFEELKRLVPN